MIKFILGVLNCGNTRPNTVISKSSFRTTALMDVVKEEKTP